MSESTVTQTANTLDEARKDQPAASRDGMTWETPKMEDVSEQVMAQPYIRFT
ncbi:hypothetical protein EV659_101120 [Rhodothalassium salexigens DSM 2132]|uniref:Uncharacterized protein n=1 Tax=Rhodothalassium salexigens DSM 2132 TaxID=1188247 RepID=A0A4R2PQW7_RHOSA|nr:hypothetical protein [Rhodothalassium salexigens]MBB4210057.1 hypothetical protein [Rhodothalassium salexigens DSM 2132]TCP38222.1 hypothetical protein EV659_101120 [Rhodothalassium salexigens DSM 2132]